MWKLSLQIGMQWESQKEKNRKEQKKKIVEKFQNLVKNVNLHIDVAQWPTDWINSKRSTPRYIINCQNVWHGENLESIKRKMIHDIQVLNKINNWFLSRNYGSQRQRDDIHNVKINQIRLSTKNSIFKHIYIFKN